MSLNQAQNKSGRVACISRSLHTLKINILCEQIRADPKFKNVLVYVTQRILLHTHNVRDTIFRNTFSKFLKYWTVNDLRDVVLLTLVEIHRLNDVTSENSVKFIITGVRT